MSLAGRVTLALALLLACAAMAGAHPMNLSTARIVLLADRQVEVEVAVRGSDADRMAGTAMFDAATGQVRVEALAGSAGSIAAYVLSPAVVALADGRACRAGAPELRPDGDGVAVRARWSCPAGPGQVLYRSTVLTDIDPAARQVVLVHGPEGESQMLLTARENELVLSEAGPPEAALEVVRRYLLAGIEHIFLGYDHIAFLLALVLWARRLWPVAKIVTAFTLAHSVTLSLAALGMVELPSAVVEPAIAASIVFVAVERFRLARHRGALACQLSLRPRARLRLRGRIAGIRPAARGAGDGARRLQCRGGDRPGRARRPPAASAAGRRPGRGPRPRRGGAAGFGGPCGLRRDRAARLLLVPGAHDTGLKGGLAC